MRIPRPPRPLFLFDGRGGGLERMVHSEVLSIKYVIDEAIAEDAQDVLLELEGCVVDAGEPKQGNQLSSQQCQGHGVTTLLVSSIS